MEYRRRSQQEELDNECRMCCNTHTTWLKSEREKEKIIGEKKRGDQPANLGGKREGDEAEISENEHKPKILRQNVPSAHQAHKPTA